MTIRNSAMVKCWLLNMVDMAIHIMVCLEAVKRMGKLFIRRY